MNKILMLLLSIVAFSAGALDVDVDELKSVDKNIVFVNYEGAYTHIDTAIEIKGIGKLLSDSLKRSGTEGKFLLKYKIIRAVDPEEKEKYDADILSIDEDASVDHIDNVRRILAGYLESAYGYSFEDAHLLAVFTTIYNAVYRGGIDYFSQKYKNIVLSYLTAQNAGLSTRYFEWPGATRILIPLTDEAAEGHISSLSTTELTDEKVIEEMREQEDMGLEDRKEMVEFKEREVEEKKKELEAEKQALLEQKAALAEKSDIKESDIKEKEKEIKKAESAVAEKEKEIEKERQEIIEDERSKDKKPVVTETESKAISSSVFSDNLYFLNVNERDSNGTKSSLFIIDPVGEKISITSPVSRISRRAYYFFKEKILLAARTTAGSTKAKLHLLNPQDLTELAVSGETIYSESFIILQSGMIYAVIDSNGSYRLGRFDENLKLLAGSAKMVGRDSAFSLFGNKIYIKSSDGKILVLDSDDLEEKGEIK